MDAFDHVDIDGRTLLCLLRLRGFVVEILLFIISSVVIISVFQELCQHALNVIKGFMLSLESLFLGLHTAAEIIIRVIVGHIN